MIIKDSKMKIKKIIILNKQKFIILAIQKVINNINVSIVRIIMEQIEVIYFQNI